MMILIWVRNVGYAFSIILLYVISKENNLKNVQ